jgi:PAS domain S-box-containing protein
MYPALPSAFLAEASAPLILLGGAVLLYRSFREKYLLPWIAGWAVYSLAKLGLVLAMDHAGEPIWLALANGTFAFAIGLFAVAIFSYVQLRRLLLVGMATLIVMLLGVLQALWFRHSGVLFFIFAACWRLIAWPAALRLMWFARGRGNAGAWVLGASFFLLRQYHPTLAYGILVDVLLGIGMMMIVLDDSRVQIQRSETLNQLARLLSDSDDFLPIADTALAELMKATRARSAWFRMLEDDGSLKLVLQRGVPEAFTDTLKIINPRSIGYSLEEGKVVVLKVSEIVPEARSLLTQHGVHHIVVVPVVGKTSQIGVLVLAMRRHRVYTQHDRDFLLAAANQLGLAAENYRLLHQLVGSIKDLTQAKATEEHYKALFDHMQEGVFVSVPEGRILDCNQAFADMLGYSSREELLKVRAEELYVSPEDWSNFLAQIERQGFVRNFEMTLKRKDGRRITVIESSFATRNAAGAIERCQGVLLDITEKKQAENEIRRRNRELSALNSIAVTFNQSFDLDEILRATLLKIVELFSTDTAAVYLFDETNNTLRKKVGYGHHSSWLNDSSEFAMPAELVESIKAEHTEVIKNPALSDVSPFPEQFVEAEGLKAWLWMVMWRKEKILGVLGTSSRSEREFGPADENIMVAVGRQLATTIDKIQLYEETRKAYEDLRRTQEQLLQSEKMSAVGRLISGVAHELNNPLTAISGYTQLLESEELDPNVQEFIQKLRKQTERAQRIVQNLLSFARQHKPQRIYADLRKVMEDTIALRDFELKANRIVLERNFASALPSVVADPHQLEQVFLNIINNAVDAILESGRGGVLRIRIFSEGSDVVCEFHDSGRGMTDPKHVFDPFYTTKGVGKGTGLGLSICYGIVKEHGGEISAQNHPAGGALVRVRLPAAVGERPMKEGERIAARRETQLRGRVLLVDSDAVLTFEREVLVAAGLEVTAVSSAVDALERLKREIFDVVLLDRDIQGEKSSKDILHWLKESQPELASRTVLMLEKENHSTPRSFVNSSNTLCFVKPFEASELLAVLRRILRPSSTRAAVT